MRVREFDEHDRVKVIELIASSILTWAPRHPSMSASGAPIMASDATDHPEPFAIEDGPSMRSITWCAQRTIRAPVACLSQPLRRSAESFRSPYGKEHHGTPRDHTSATSDHPRLPDQVRVEGLPRRGDMRYSSRANRTDRTTVDETRT